MIESATNRPETPRILIVDDEESLRNLLAELLTDMGYQTTTAKSTEEALRLFEKKPYPLVITDIHMGGLSGIELMQIIKTHNSDTQILVITSHASLNTALLALHAGAYDYLTKPFETLELLTNAVKRALERHTLTTSNRQLTQRLKAGNTNIQTDLNNEERILLVDDDTSLRELLAELLTDAGYQVTTAKSTEEALGHFERTPYPMVITDICMGGLNGIDLLQIIKQHREDTQVLIITSYASFDTALAALRAGAYDYLCKPFDELELITTTVKRAFEKIRLLAENRRLIKQLTHNPAPTKNQN